MRNGEKGISKLTAIVFGTLLLAVGYAGYCIIPFFYDFFELQNQMSALVAVADTLDDARLRSRIGKVLKEYDIPADPKDIKIDRRDHYIKFSLSYEETFYVTFNGRDHDLYVFPFTASADGPF